MNEKIVINRNDIVVMGTSEAVETLAKKHGLTSDKLKKINNVKILLKGIKEEIELFEIAEKIDSFKKDVSIFCVVDDPEDVGPKVRMARDLALIYDNFQIMTSTQMKNLCVNGTWDTNAGYGL